MVISDEIKFPKTTKIDPFKTEQKVKNIDNISAIEKVGDFRRRWTKNKQQQKTPKRGKNLTGGEQKSVREMIAKVNDDLDKQNVLIHLILVKDDEGFSIDVYDCTDNHVCKVIKDININVEDLPLLIRNLELESGLLIDKIL